MDKKLNGKNPPSKPEKTAHYLFKNGYDPRRNLEGRPKGVKNFDTIFKEAIERLAKLDDPTLKQVVAGKISVEGIDVALVRRGLIEALKGNVSFWNSIYDRRIGKSTENIDAQVTIDKVSNIDSIDPYVKGLVDEFNERLRERFSKGKQDETE